MHQVGVIWCVTYPPAHLCPLAESPQERTAVSRDPPGRTPESQGEPQEVRFLLPLMEGSRGARTPIKPEGIEGERPAPVSWRFQEEGQVGKVRLGPKSGEVQYCSCFSSAESASTGMECTLGQGRGGAPCIPEGKT